MPAEQTTVEIPTTDLEAEAVVAMTVVAVSTVAVAVIVQEVSTAEVKAELSIVITTLALGEIFQKTAIYLCALKATPTHRATQISQGLYRVFSRRKEETFVKRVKKLVRTGTSRSTQR